MGYLLLVCLWEECNVSEKYQRHWKLDILEVQTLFSKLMKPETQKNNWHIKCTFIYLYMSILWNIKHLICLMLIIYIVSYAQYLYKLKLL